MLGAPDFVGFVGFVGFGFFGFFGFFAGAPIDRTGRGELADMVTTPDRCSAREVIACRPSAASRSTNES